MPGSEAASRRPQVYRQEIVLDAAEAEEQESGNGRFLAVEEGWSIGAGASVSSSPYKKYDEQWFPLPQVSYEGEYAYIRGASAGLKLVNKEYVEASAFISYDPTSFDSADSSDRRLRRLDNRHESALVGVQARVYTPVGLFQASASGDVLGKSNGFTGDAEYNFSIEQGPVELVLTAGVAWSSSKYQDYYYGVSGKESRKSGLKEYRAGAGVSPYVGSTVVLSPTENWDVYCSGQVTFLNDNIKSSPMVGKDHTYSISGGVMYSF